MKKARSAVLKILCPMFLALALLAVADSNAWALRCTLYDPVFHNCIAYQPDYPPGGYDCVNSTPSSNEVNVYSNTNFTGFCVVFPYNVWSSNLASLGWNSPWYIKSVKVGAGRHFYWWVGTNWVAPMTTLNPGTNYPDVSGYTKGSAGTG